MSEAIVHPNFKLPVLLAFFGLAHLNATAQDHTPYSEQQQAIKSPNAVTRLGADLFGDDINLYQGTVTFRQTDVTLKGNSALPVQAGRRLVAGNFAYTIPQFAFGAWQLDMPYLYGNFADPKKSGGGGGWTDSSGGTARCSNFGPPSDTGVWAGAEFWQGTYLYVPGGGEQVLLARDPNYLLAPQNNPSAYPVVTANKWAFSCITTDVAGGGEAFLGLHQMESPTASITWCRIRSGQ